MRFFIRKAERDQNSEILFETWAVYPVHNAGDIDVLILIAFRVCAEFNNLSFWLITGKRSEGG